MYPFLILFLFFFPIPVFPTHPDHFLKSLPLSLQSQKSQEYFEITQPLPADHLTPSCTHTVIHNSFANTINSPPFSAPYSPPSDCPSPWSYVVLELRVKCRGDQYDRISGIWLGGAELLRTSTAEPTKCGIYWKVRKDITRYSSLLVKQNLDFTMMLENVVNEKYTGIYHVDVILFFYKDNVAPGQSLIGNMGKQHVGGVDMLQGSGGLYEPAADLIIPISDDGDKGFWFRIESESDIHTRGIIIPPNTYRAILELYVSFHGNDEFWYSNPPNSYIRMNNLTTGRGNGAYREVFVTIDGKFVGSEVPFPIVFTGGINPLFWEPVVAIGAFSLPSYDFDVTPFLGLLLDGKFHEFGIGINDGISYWLVDANLHLWLDHGSSAVKAKSVAYINPALNVGRREQFKLLDGSFKVKARRKCQFVGWVISKAGNLTTVVSQEFKFNNMIRFKQNGTYKVVSQRIKAKREVKISSSTGSWVTRVASKRRYPLNVITATIPGTKKNRYMLVTNVSHSLREKYSNGDFSSSLSNIQDSQGWMEVKDHSVLSGEANTSQSFSYRDMFTCYSRAIAVYKGRLIQDNSTMLCASSM